MTGRLGVQKGKPLVLKWSAAVVVALLAIVGAFYADTHGREISQAATLATTRQPEPFTELYFDNIESLPQKATPGQSVSVSFVIRNLENQQFQYQYAITFTDSQGAVRLYEGDVQIQSSQSQTITHNVVVPDGQGRGKVGVQLTNKGQSVHYWLERT